VFIKVYVSGQEKPLCRLWTPRKRNFCVPARTNFISMDGRNI